MSERNYYVLCDDNCKFESMTKEQIIAAIANATGVAPTNLNDVFISKIKEQNKNNSLRFWVGTQAEYNELTPENNVFYIFTDTNEIAELQTLAENAARAVVTDAISSCVVNGDFAVIEANVDTEADIEPSAYYAIIPYPEGFTYYNCCVISAMFRKLVQGETTEFQFATGMSLDLDFDSHKYAPAHTIQLDEDNIRIYVRDVVGAIDSTLQEDYYRKLCAYRTEDPYLCRLVLMKYDNMWGN